jgi:hypothetical protein
MSKPMISIATRTKLLMIVATLGALLSGSLIAFGQKSCECGEPSVGTVTCEDGQEPFCTVRSGKVHGRCKSSGGRRGESLQRWIFSEAIGRPITDSEWQAPEVQDSLKAGGFVYRTEDKSGELIRVTFRPSKDLEQSPSEKPDLLIRRPEDLTKETGPTETTCEVCVVVSGVNRCKTIASKSEKDLKAAAAELCQSDRPCLNKPPAVKCPPR